MSRRKRSTRRADSTAEQSPTTDGASGTNPTINYPGLEQGTFRAQRLQGLGMLAGEVAHDLNNLLMGVLGHLDLASEASGDSDLAETHMNLAQQCARLSTEVTQQLLTYLGDDEQTSAPVDLSALVAELSSLFHVAVGKKARLTFNTQPKTAISRGDATQIRQVMLNVVGNAADALGGDKGEIELRTGIEDFDPAVEDGCGLMDWASPGSYAFFEVSDSGSGMSDEARGRMFDPHFTTKAEGHGLGLAVVRDIVARHGGYVRVDSKVDVGTRVRVGFPRATEVVDAPEPTAPGATPRQFSGTALLADDDAAVRSVTRKMLERHGFDVIEAVDGRSVVQSYVQNSGAISLVVLDWAMPEMSGVEALHEIRACDARQRVLFVSGYSLERRRTDLEDERSIVLQKPYGREELAHALSRLFDDQ